MASRRRLLRVRLGLRALFACDRCTGTYIERIAGHMKFISLVARTGLVRLSATYAFMREYRREGHKQWPAIQESVLPLLRPACRSLWCEPVVMTDTSFWGPGADSKHCWL